MTDPDRLLIESTRTHRERLLAAMVHGPLTARRKVTTNAGRFTGSLVLTAVLGLGTVGAGFVVGYLDRQENEKAVTAFQEALTSNPLEPRDGLVEDESTGLLYDEERDVHLDPATGFEVDPETMLATDPQGRLVDTRTRWYFDPETGYYTDPATGVTVDPDTLTVVEEK